MQLPRWARCDSGIEEGQHITPHYDPMIAKIITTGDTRIQALAKMTKALEATRVAGLDTNTQFLHAVCNTPDFADGNISTNFNEEHQETLFAPKNFGYAFVIAAGLWCHQSSYQAHQTNTGSPSPWAALPFWRLNQPATETMWLRSQGDASKLTLIVQEKEVRGTLETKVDASARKKIPPLVKGPNSAAN